MVLCNMPLWGRLWWIGVWVLCLIHATNVAHADDDAGHNPSPGFFGEAHSSVATRQRQQAPPPTPPHGLSQQGGLSTAPSQVGPSTILHMRALLAAGQGKQQNDSTGNGQTPNNAPPGQQNNGSPSGQPNNLTTSGQQNDNNPPGQQNDNNPPGQQNDNNPPGQQNDNNPPGQQNDNSPPGQQNDNNPPGQQNNDTTSGQQNDNNAPGQQNDNNAPGQQNGNNPPGQQNDNNAPGQQNGNNPPGQQNNNNASGQGNDQNAPGQSKQVTIDYNSSIFNSTLQLDGELLQAQILPSATYSVPAKLWHRIYMVVVTTDGAPLSNPSKAPRLTLTIKTGTSPDQVVRSQWSQSKQSCVLQFRLSVAAVYTAILELGPKSAAGSPGNSPKKNTVAQTTFYFDTYDLIASALTSNISLVSNGTLVGSYVYVVADLRTAPVSGYASGRPVHNMMNVTVSAVGSLSGSSSLGNLARFSDGTWSTKFLLRFEEVMTFQLKVGGQLASASSLNVSGYSATYDSTFSALGSAKLLLGTDQQDLRDDVELKSMLGHHPQVHLPVAALNATVSNPELAVAVLYRPVDPEVTLVTRYNLGRTPQASSNTSVPTNDTGSNTTGSGNTTVPGPGNVTAPTEDGVLDIDYYDDYAEEPVDLSALMPDEYPDPSYAFFGGPGMPVAAGTASSSLWNTSSKWIGVFEPASARYSIQLTPLEPQTYTATLLAQNPNTTAEHLMGTFFLTAHGPAKSTAVKPAQTSSVQVTTSKPASADDTVTVTLFNPLLHARVSFMATLVVANTSSMSNLLNKVVAAVAAAAQVPSTDWVQASLERNDTAGNITNNSTLHASVWFPPTDVEATTLQVTDAERLIFLLLRSPNTIFEKLKYLISTVKVSDVTIAPAGSESISASAFLSSNSSATADAAFEVVAVPASSLPSSTAKPFNWSRIDDKQPPVIKLRGKTYVELLEGRQYTDAGAAVWDAVDGKPAANQSIRLCYWENWMVTASAADDRAIVCNSTILSAVNTSQATDNQGAYPRVYVITYTASDSAGNTAVPLRRFVVSKTRCRKPERWCSSVKACSIMGVCYQALLGSNRSESASSSSSTDVPAVDVLPPRLRLLGNGTAALTLSGGLVMVDTVEWMSDWSDPGATAMDDTEGNVTHMIQASRSGAVDTSLPTAPSQNFSYVIQYSVSDLAGNTATASRVIRVVCPDSEVYCTNPYTDQPTCTVGGVCGIPAVLNTTSRGRDDHLQQHTASSPELQPPVISLLAADRIEVPTGFAYDRCSDAAPLFEVCDKGATAWDIKDGNLDRQVLVCGHRWLSSNQERLVPLHLACAISVDTPGEYNLTFSVTNSAGLSATVVRKVVVVANCSEGEVLCPDKISCGEAGTCLTQTTLSGSLPTLPSSAPAPATQLHVNISLITAPDFGPLVQVKKMTPYLPCREGIRPTAAAPCEPGAEASVSVSYVDKNSTTTKVDLTADVVVCPPAFCFTDGCSPTELRKHTFAVKGLDGCEVTTAADVGTIFNISFWVWDKQVPAQNATVTRTVVIIEPCPDSTAQYFCTDDSKGASFCSGVPCQQALAMLPAAPAAQPVKTVGQPRILLLPSDEPLYLEYGQVSPVKLQPCKTATQRNSCGAVAMDVADTEVVSDLTLHITVTAGQGCRLDDNLDQKVCISCTVEALSAGRGCLPGSYDVVYNVTNEAGMVATATRTVMIYQQAQVWAVVPLVQNVANSGSAMVLVRDLRNGVVEAVDTAARSVLYKLGPAAAGFSASDIQVVGAYLRQHAVQNLTVFVNVTVKLYTPECMRDVQTNATTVPASNTRRLQSTTGPSRGPVHVPALLQQVVSVLRYLAADAHMVCLQAELGINQHCRMGGPRRLLATASPASTQISALAAALTAAAGASDVIVRSTPDVDELQGHLASLWSSVMTIDQHLSAFLSSSAAIATGLETAYGGAVQQDETMREVQVGRDHQGLVGDWQSLVSDLTSVMDHAVGTSGQQAEANQAVFTLTQESMAAIKDATQLAQRLQEQYVQQELLLTADSDTLQWSCNRTSTLLVHFNVTGSSLSAGRAPSLRNGGELPVSSDGVQESLLNTLWHGYMVPKKAAASSTAAVNGVHSGQPGRFVGALGHNSVVGGLLLHTTRRRLAGDCMGDTFMARFSDVCHRHALPLVRNTSQVAEYLSSLFASDSNVLLPYGVDPAFLHCSGLYQPQLQGQAGWFYNQTDPLEVPESTGIPKGFYHRHLQGYADGFPVLLPNELSAQRSALVLQYLKDGNYLDKNSQGLTAELLTFNADLGLLGATRISFRWQDNGVITGFIDVQSLPALQHASMKIGLLDRWLVLLWVMTGCFLVHVCAAISRFLETPEDQAMQATSPGVGLLLDLATAALTLTASISLSQYWNAARAASHPQTSYLIYDAVSSSTARILLPAKLYSEAAVLHAQEHYKIPPTATNSNSSRSSSGWQPLLPGDPGRWVLPDDDRDFDKFAEMLGDVRGLLHLWDQYTLLQGMVLMLLTIRLLNAWSFQAKLGIIVNTLAKAAPQLTHLLLVISAVLLTYSGLINIAWGSTLEAASSYIAALQETFSTLVGLGTITVWDVVPDNEFATYLQLILRTLVYYGLILLFILILLQYFMAVIGQAFIALKRDKARKKARSIAADIVEDVLPELRLLPNIGLYELQQLCCGDPATQRDSMYKNAARPAGSCSSHQLLSLLETAHTSSLPCSATRRPDMAGGSSASAVQNAAALHAVLKQLTDSFVNNSSSSISSAETSRVVDSLCAVGGSQGVCAALVAANASKLPFTPHKHSGVSVASPKNAGCHREESMQPGQPAATDDAHQPHSPCTPASEQLCHRNVLLEGVRQPAREHSNQSQQNQQLDRVMMHLQREIKLHTAIYSNLWNAIHGLERWSTAALKWQQNAAKQGRALSLLIEELLIQQQQHDTGRLQVEDVPVTTDSEVLFRSQGSRTTGTEREGSDEIRHTAVLASSLCGVYGSESSPGGARIATTSSDDSDGSEGFVVGNSNGDDVVGSSNAYVRPTRDVIVSVNSWVDRWGEGGGDRGLEEP